MELEVGMYIISKDRLSIGILHSRDENGIWLVKTKNGLEFKGIFWNTQKASHNIIDLIEVGDIVNGSKVDEIDYEHKAIWLDNRYSFNDSISYIDIKEILTKEQYEANVYRMESDE